MEKSQFEIAVRQVAEKLKIGVNSIDDSHLLFSKENSRLKFSLEFIESGIFAYIYFRSTSWDWDGERTDVNDMFSVLPALLLRVAPPYTSCLLYDLEHPIGDMPESEIYARYIVPVQPDGQMSLSADSVERVSNLLTALAVYETHVLAFVEFDLKVPNRYSYQDEALVLWIAKVRAALGQDEQAEASYNIRTNPHWMYYRSKAVGASIYHSPATALQLKNIIDQTRPWKELSGPTADFFKSEFARNAASREDVKRCEGILRQLESSNHGGTILIPFENRLVALGAEHVIILEVECDRAKYNAGREAIVARQRFEHDTLFDGRRYAWKESIDGGRFEEFTRDLLSRKSGVVQVRKTSLTYEGDANADLLCIWDVPALADIRQPDGVTPLVRRTIIVQCKAWASAVGKADVPDIRDALDRHEASGFLVVAPAVRRSLVDHLRALRQRDIWADYWDRGELEEQLDANPDLVKKYGDIVSFASMEE